MGFLNVPVCSLASSMPQTQRNVYFVRNFGGFTHGELAEQVGISEAELKAAESGEKPLTNSDWRKVIDVCGSRAFDHDPE